MSFSVILWFLRLQDVSFFFNLLVVGQIKWANGWRVSYTSVEDLKKVSMAATASVIYDSVNFSILPVTLGKPSTLLLRLLEDRFIIIVAYWTQQRQLPWFNSQWQESDIEVWEGGSTRALNSQWQENDIEVWEGGSTRARRREEDIPKGKKMILKKEEKVCSSVVYMMIFAFSCEQVKKVWLCTQ